MIRIILGTLSLIMVSGCAKDSFDRSMTQKEYKDLSSETVAVKPVTVAGIDIWDKGVPNKKYIVLGVINDKRRNVGYSQDSYNQSIAKLTQKAGGDAAIVLLSESKIVDTVAQGCGSSPGNQGGENCAGGASGDPSAPGGSETVYSQNREATDAVLEYRVSHVLVIKYVK
ncbi:hypothetical protein F6R98_02620 [Candidatus Methylospira mobilis]|uniref:Lipoprotein n=1 Tax=Candidatus Methylospira mobilis TaxID=1808979 RepID=A0A5Q0BHM0_9GAMM|nr:hypothetical protein [Candidatus Methylospira mobilis]QFY41654.1 hypothetical protein F6R98_02620 [Candidatus Methylospira mobilis]WNV03540.1 hypothetical protein RP726_13915 [Candidatus Methylospira mobilis]WNV05094.1 hypothetical protein RP726_01470 [Candidatus Methylospira mobilis]